MDEIKRCCVCKEYKLLTEFYKYSRSKDGRNPQCVECKRKSSRGYYELSRPERKQKQRDYELRKYYSTTLEEYTEMFEDQKGLCALCGNPPMGMLNDDPYLCIHTAHYLLDFDDEALMSLVEEYLDRD